MRRTIACAAVLTAATSVLLPQGAGLAAEQRRILPVDASAWSWRTLGPAGLPVTEPSNVPAGGLAVQYDGRPGVPPAKATYLRLGLSDIAAGAQVSALTLVVPLDRSVSQDGTAGPVVACSLAGDFPVGTARDPATMPAEDCTGAPVGSYDRVAQTLSFALVGLANRWAAGQANHGIVLRPDPASALPDVRPFQLTFVAPKLVEGLLTVQLADLVPTPTAALPGVDVPIFVAPEIAPKPGFFPLFAAPIVGTQPMRLPTLATAPVVPIVRPQIHQAPPRFLRAAGRFSQAGLAGATVLGLLLLAMIGWSLGDVTHPRAFVRAERRRLDRFARGPILVVQPVVQRRQGRRPLSSATSTVTYS